MNSYPEREIPVLNTEDLVVFPGSTLTLRIQKKQNVAAVKRAQSGERLLLAVSHRDRESPSSASEGLARVGVLVRLESARTGKSGILQIVVRGLERYSIVEMQEKEDVLLASGAALLDRSDADDETLKSLRSSLEATAIEVLEMLPSDTGMLIEEVKKILDPSEFSYVSAQYMNLPQSEAQGVLEMTSVKNRLLRLLELLVSRREALKVQSRIKETLSENLGKKQREVLLREQLKAIHDELGDSNDGPSADDYRKRVADAHMSEEAQKIALREVSRLERMGDQSAESHVIRNYLDLLIEMPWNKTSQGEIDLDRAQATLDRDHYGLDKIKRRILEHLAVMKLRPEKRGSIVLFLGPPGVGKTSLGKSIAEALGREFVRASLGGVRDDADIRGHRRTYVGALPGRIIDGIRRAKTKDPVFVLDEIDKLARGWGGDPSSALLEVLDPEQNESFHDHYLDVPFDLSQVLFVCTANSRESIPGPLLDRMEVIELSGYTADEKFHIAKDHLWPTELEVHGLKPEQVSLEDVALHKIIEGYTREAGVRSLRRELSKIARAAAALVVRNPQESVVVSELKLRDMLGAVKFEAEEMGLNDKPGVVTGMAWTPVGGDVLFVEAAAIPGDGKVVVTGQLGDVMKESSQIAVALARSRLEGIAKSVLFKDRDIHIHVPGGAVPKDGPSAGVTMFTTIASMMLGRAVSPKLAMTGEITLRGKVLPVGGIKEKVLAAARYGVKEIILPLRNAKDLDDLPVEVRRGIEFKLVSDVDELLRLVFGALVPIQVANVDESLRGVLPVTGAVYPLQQVRNGC
ncbi:MAG: endopeptidase La [Deltaproteobacteria bacterium]|nr:endopeptidase La [Deltaproteobacteria bacterium]